MQKFIDYAENLRKVVVNQRALIYGLISAVVVMSAVIGYMATHHAQYLVPYGLDKKVAVAVNRIEPDYLVQLALADAAAYFNIDRSSIQNQSALFLSRIDPEVLDHVAVDIQSRNHEIIHNNISQVFYPIQRYVHNHSHRVLIKGVLKQWLSGKLIGNHPIVLHADYVNQNGRLLIHQWRSQND